MLVPLSSLPLCVLTPKAEGLIEAGLYPYPTYEAMLYSHHS